MTVGLATGQSDAATSSATFTVTFSEPVTGFGTSSVTLTESGTGSATVSSVTPVSTTAYDVVVNGTGYGSSYETVTLSVAAGKVHDAAGDGNLAFNGQQ